MLLWVCSPPEAACCIPCFFCWAGIILCFFSDTPSFSSPVHPVFLLLRSPREQVRGRERNPLGGRGRGRGMEGAMATRTRGEKKGLREEPKGRTGAQGKGEPRAHRCRWGRANGELVGWGTPKHEGGSSSASHTPLTRGPSSAWRPRAVWLPREARTTS